MDVAFSGRSVRSAVCVLILSGATALLSLVPSCGGSPFSGELQGEARQRWNARERGKILFVSPEETGIQGTLWTLGLPSRVLTKIPLPDSVHPTVLDSGPVGGHDSNVYISFIGEAAQGLYEFDLESKMARLLLEEGSRSHPGESDRGVSVPDESGLLIIYEPPSVTFFVSSFDFAPVISQLCILMHFEINHGPPDWRVDPDSLDLPEWADELVRARLAQDVRKWDDLIVLDSSRELSWVREMEEETFLILTTNSDGTYLAWTNTHGVEVFDVERQEILRPAVPESTLVNLCSFSPDGRTLAALGCDRRGPGIYFSHAPSFAEFELVYRISHGIPRGICWSPDGDWILLHVVKGHLAFKAQDLVALELASGEEVDILRPYLHNSQPAPDVLVSSMRSWTR